MVGSLVCGYSDYRWRKLFASVIENAKQKAAEIDRLRGIIWTREDTIRDHKEQIADLEDTIEVLRDEREKHAKRILSLEDSYRAKCKEAEATDWEIEACRSVRFTAMELREQIDQFIKAASAARSESLFSPLTTITTPTFQPKRPTEQQQKPTCDN